MALSIELIETLKTAQVAELPKLYYCTVQDGKRLFISEMTAKARNPIDETITFDEQYTNAEGKLIKYSRVVYYRQLSNNETILTRNSSLFRGIFESEQSAIAAAQEHLTN